MFTMPVYMSCVSSIPKTAQRPMSSYLRPSRLDEALVALADGERIIVAGGTDFYPARVGRPLEHNILDVTGMDSLRGIADRGDHHLIGALTTWTDILRADLPGWFRTLKLAAREVGGVQVQNAGTVAGNLCNASPAADGVPCLMAMDARVVLASAGATRTLELPEFILGNRRTARRPDEMVVGIEVPKPVGEATSTFIKLGARKYLVISIAMVAAVLERAADGTVASLRIAVGSCSEVARRLPALEQALAGRPVDGRLADHVGAAHVAPLSPIDDVRGTAEYRMDAAVTIVRRAVGELANGEAQ